MNKGLIYLIQPEELIGTKRFKIGCSSKTNLDRLKNYKKGTRHILIMECYNPFSLEKIIKQKLNEKFKLIAGKEFFEGEELILKHEVIDIIINYDNKKLYDNNNFNIVDIKIDDEIDNDKLKEIENNFIDFREDYNFGGKKHLIKILIRHNYALNYNINFLYISKYEIDSYEIFIDDLSSDPYKFFKKLINNKIIENNKIYDLNNKSFIKKINNCKTKINNVILSKKIIEKFNNFQPYYNSKLSSLFSDSIINNSFCDSLDKNTFLISDSKDDTLKVFKLLNKYYDYLYLREFIPYVIEYNQDSFYTINRDYVYIGINTKCNPDENRKWERLCLFNDNNPCWIYNNKIESEKNFLKIKTQFKDITKNKKWLNLDINTEQLILK